MFLLTLVFVVETCFVQAQQVRINHIPGSNGIALGRITCFTQDRQGVIWITDQDNHCLIRYDGTQMKRYAYKDSTEGSPGGRYPEFVTTDTTGNIWVAYKDMGIDRFDPETERFSHFRHQTNDPGSLGNDCVFVLLADHLGNLWVGTEAGLDLLDLKTGKFRHFHHSDLDPTSLSDDVIRALYEDREGTIWVGTGMPWIEPIEKGGLNRLHRETGTFTRYVHDPSNPHSLINNKVRSLFEDSRGIFWIGTGGDGLHTLDRKTGIIERHTYDPARPEKLSRPPVLGNEDHICFITEDALGCIWIGTWANGMVRYDPSTGKLTHFGGTADTAGLFRDKSCWCAKPSNDGVLWVCTQEPNFYKMELFTNTFARNATKIGGVYSFLEESPTVLWLGTDSGLVRQDLATGRIDKYLNEPLGLAKLNLSGVGALVRDDSGNIWVGTYGAGLIRFDPRSRTFSNFRHDAKNVESICSDEIFALYADGGSGLWVGTIDGMDRMDMARGVFIHYRSSENYVNTVSGNLTTAFLKEGPDILWIGKRYSGLDKMNIRTGKSRHYLPSGYITSIYQDAAGVIWIGATDGLHRYDRERDGFSLICEGKEGQTVNSVACIIGDAQDNLWVSSSSGIYRINKSRDQIILFDERNGVGEFITQQIRGVPALRRSNGQILLGSPIGYYSFFPDKLKIAAASPKIEFTDLWLKGISVKPGEGPLPEPLSRTKVLRLEHDENAFSLGFSAVDFSDPADKAFYYKLDNHDGEWRQSSADQRAYYYNVSPGKYLFRVKVLNIATGKSAETTLSIVVLGPWWTSWWAYCMYAILVAAGLYIFSRVQKRRGILKERERGMLKDLEMQALRAQMNPHFIFNCLSSINNFIMNKESQEAADYLTKFSRLIRTVLNNSKKSYISLEDELEMLGLYLEMEQLRFVERFTYRIDIDGEVDSSAIYIPPLLFQPFVENAVWHGLMHKTTGSGRLEISLRCEKDLLICVIEDNGVGRESARVLESKSAEKKKSMGIQITQQRLALINANGEITGNEFSIEDLYDGVGHAAGTKVLLRIHYKEIKDVQVHA
jgi:ligand-binding sensor domain-containing protein